MMAARFASQFQLAFDGESMLTIVRLRIAKRGILHVLFVIGLLSLPLLSADKPKDGLPPAPVPSPIAAARKVFRLEHFPQDRKEVKGKRSISPLLGSASVLRLP